MANISICISTYMVDVTKFQNMIDGKVDQCLLFQEICLIVVCLFKQLATRFGKMLEIPSCWGAGDKDMYISFVPSKNDGSSRTY